MKNYEIYVDITMSAVIHVEAENEEEAKKIANETTKDQPYYYAGQGCYVSHEITDVFEDKSE